MQKNIFQGGVIKKINGSYGPFVFFILLLCCFAPVWAVIETYEFDTPEQEARYHHFTDVLRCPKCQNQNLTGSNSPIAEDLRRELANQVRNGKSDQQIVDFMVARYGDFILYDPPFKKNTLLLWLAPLVLLLLALLILRVLLRRRPAADAVVFVTELSATVREPAFLSQRRAFMVLGATGCVVLLAVGLLYRQLGAGESLVISNLTRAFYQEVATAAAEQRQPDLAMARELLDRLADYPPSEEERLQLLYLQGSLYTYLSEFQQAIPYYKEYLMAMPTDERVLTEYVQILYLAADRQLTERVNFVVERALTLNPHNREVLSLLALHYFDQGDYVQAIRYWQRVLRTMAADDPARAMIERAVGIARAESKKG